jgi:hypothetical protein
MAILQSDLITEFDRLPNTALVSQKIVAILLGYYEAEIERDRWAGTGIPFIKVGRMVRYRKADIIAHAAQYKPVRSTTEVQAAAAPEDIQASRPLPKQGRRSRQEARKV